MGKAFWFIDDILGTSQASKFSNCLVEVSLGFVLFLPWNNFYCKMLSVFKRALTLKGFSLWQ